MTTRSDDDGRYRLRLAPGQYTLTVTTDGFPRCTPTVVIVRPATTITKNLSCDTGIR